MLEIVAPLSSETFSRALIMPNLVPPVTTKEAVNEIGKIPNVKTEAIFLKERANKRA